MQGHWKTQEMDLVTNGAGDRETGGEDTHGSSEPGRMSRQGWCEPDRKKSGEMNSFPACVD